MEVSRGLYFGNVNGIYFDLRHELLQYPEWESPILGCYGGNDTDEPDLPLIWFPWFDALEAYNIEIEQDNFDENPEVYGHKPPKRPQGARMRKFGRVKPEYIAGVGDRIVIEFVERFRTGNLFDHPHDEQIRRAYLVVEKSNGVKVDIKRPMVYRGDESMIESSSSLNGIDTIKRRICRHYGIESIERWESVQKENTYAYRALLHAKNITYMLDNERLFDRNYCLQEGARLGYLWAKAEAEINIKPLAEEAIRIKQRSKDGGKESGRIRGERAENGWRTFARMLAKEICAEKPGASHDKIAEDIMFDWRPSWPPRPGFSSLRKLVGQMDRLGELPRPSAR